MKTLKTHFQLIAILLTTIVLFQSCIAYKKTNANLEDAVKAETTIKIKMIDNKTLMFDRVEFENDYYFGRKFKSGDDVKIRLNENQISEVKIKDKKKTAFKNIVGIPLIIIGTFIVGFGLSLGAN